MGLVATSSCNGCLLLPRCFTDGPEESGAKQHTHLFRRRQAHIATSAAMSHSVASFAPPTLPHSARYVDFRGNPDRRSQVEYMKAYVFESETSVGPQVWWELRLIVPCLTEKPEQSVLHTWWRFQKENWQRLCRDFALHELEVRPSVKAAAARPTKFEGMDFVLPEFIVSTAGCLALLLRVAHHGKSMHARERSQALLHDLLVETLSGTMRADADNVCEQCMMDESDIFELEEPVCNHTPETDTILCVHTASMQRHIDKLHMQHPASLGTLLGFLYTSRGERRRVESWLMTCFDNIAKQIDTAMLGNSLGRSEPAHLPTPQGRKRRRRLDVGLRQSVLDAVAAKRFRSSVAMSRSGELQVPESTAKGGGDGCVRRLCLGDGAHRSWDEADLVVPRRFPARRRGPSPRIGCLIRVSG